MLQIGAFTFRKMDEANAHQIATWHYDPPYDFYNGAADYVTGHILEPLGMLVVFTLTEAMKTDAAPGTCSAGNRCAGCSAC